MPKRSILTHSALANAVADPGIWEGGGGGGGGGGGVTE